MPHHSRKAEYVQSGCFEALGQSQVGSPLTLALGQSRVGSPLTLALGQSRAGSPLTLALGQSRVGSPLTLALGQSRVGSPLTLALGQSRVGSPLTLYGLQFHRRYHFTLSSDFFILLAYRISTNRCCSVYFSLVRRIFDISVTLVVDSAV